MTHADWVVFVKVCISAFAIFYFRVWAFESSRARSWKAGHARLWKKP